VRMALVAASRSVNRARRCVALRWQGPGLCLDRRLPACHSFGIPVLSNFVIEP
jgi:hypothetical protein